MEKYFVITSNEDGINISEYSEGELLAALKPDKYGDSDVQGPFFKKIPDIDKGCWYEEEGCLIIKGEIIQPKAKTVATEYEL